MSYRTNNEGIFEDLKRLEETNPTIIDYFGDKVLYIPNARFGDIQKLNESQTYQNIARITSRLCKNSSLKLCCCTECCQCRQSNLYSKGYMHHNIMSHMKHNIYMLECLYIYIEKYIDHSKILNSTVYYHNSMSARASHTLFWFLDICDKKNIDFTIFITHYYYLTDFNSDIVGRIVQEYSAKICRNEKIILSMIDVFDTSQKKYRMMFMISLICKHSNGKYKYIEDIKYKDAKDTKDKFNEFISSTDMKSITNIIVRHIDVNIRFMILF